MADLEIASLKMTDLQKRDGKHPKMRRQNLAPQTAGEL
jgi:hypothetical protein